MTLDIRTLAAAPDEFPDWLRAVATGFLRVPDISPEEVTVRRADADLTRTVGAYDDTYGGGRCVATFRSFPQELTVPGGARVNACAVSNVTVAATHRRRGLLTRMMAQELRAAKERGEVMASLTSAEYPIYGRYGFGPAAWCVEYEVESARTGLDPRYSGPADGGRVDLVDGAEVRRVAPELYDRFRAQPHRQGVIERGTSWWRRHTGLDRFEGDGFTPRFHALYRDADGVPQGLAAYTVDDHWEAKLPEETATVLSLFGTTPAAERALWLFLLSMDWVSRVRTGLRAPDDVLPLLVPDPRAARIKARSDFLWLRPLDVPAMLEARAYPVTGTLVLDLRDEAGLAGGRYRLEAGPEGAKCVETREDADLSMEIGELGTLYLGDESATRLVALDRVEEHGEGAATTADVLFRTARRPWCPDVF
ncbi:GNAT family N-acetyltransferase [Streptomyces sp. NPDC054796]